MPTQANPQEIPLRDIHLPSDVSWWPPAIGWWLLLGIILIIFAFISTRKARQNNKRLQKSSVQAFYRIKVDFHLNKNTHQTIEELSILLRRIALSYYDRHHIASISGDDWLKQLDKLANNQNISFLNSTGRILTQAPYQKKSELDISELLTLCENWIKSLPSSKQTFKKRQPS